MAHTQVTIINAHLPGGYSGVEHLITASDRDRVRRLIGTSYPSRVAAEQAADDAFSSGADARLWSQPVHIETRTARR